MSKLYSVLQFGPAQVKEVKPLRQKSIEDAVALAGGSSHADMVFHILWSGYGYEVGVGKPGKETERERPNPYDMWPFIRRDGKFEEESATFRQIFYELEHISTKSPRSLELLGCLLARSAYMLDHETKDGRVIYNPPQTIIDEIKKDIPMMFKVPLEVFLQYLEMIALNEDVKYQKNLNTKGKPYGKAAGRQNNLLTCAHLISILLKRSGVVDFAYGFAQKRGVSPLSTKLLPSSFPMLSIDKTEAKQITVETES